MLKVGIIGNGGIAKVHSEAYHKLKQEDQLVEVAAYCDIRREQLQDLGSCRTYTDIDQFLEKEKGKIDFVDICLPTYLHAEVTIKAMQSGFDVLCEKPMALNEQQCQAMCRAEQETGQRFMIAQCQRFSQFMIILKQIVDSGKLGTFKRASFNCLQGVSTNAYQDWFHVREKSGGALLDLHVHDLDVVNWIFGKPEAVSVAGKIVIPGSGYDSLSANLMFRDFYIHANCDWTINHCRYDNRAVHFDFTRGYVFNDRSPGNRKVFMMIDENGHETDLMQQIVPEDVYYNEIRYYARNLLDDKPFDRCLPASTTQSIRIAMAEMKSADAGGAVVKLD